MRRMVFGAFIALMLCIVLLSRLSGPSEMTEVTAEPEVTVAKSDRTLPAKPDPAPIIDKKALARETMAEFVAAYYGRDVRLLEGTVADRSTRFADRLRPYVTAKFLQRYPPPLTTRQDLAIKLYSGTVIAEIVSYGSGHIDDNRYLDQTVLVVQRVAYPDERTLRYSLRLTIAMVYDGTHWLVQGIQERYINQR